MEGGGRGLGGQGEGGGWKEVEEVEIEVKEVEVEVEEEVVAVEEEGGGEGAESGGVRCVDVTQVFPDTLQNSSIWTRLNYHLTRASKPSSQRLSCFHHLFALWYLDFVHFEG